MFSATISSHFHHNSHKTERTLVYYFSLASSQLEVCSHIYRCNLIQTQSITAGNKNRFACQIKLIGLMFINFPPFCYQNKLRRTGKITRIERRQFLQVQRQEIQNKKSSKSYLLYRTVQELVFILHSLVLSILQTM